MSCQTFSIQHHTIHTALPFDQAIDRLKSRLPRLDLPTQPTPALLEAWRDVGGLMLFNILDHGALLKLLGHNVEALQIVLGNPSLALQMTQHGIGAALYAPLRLLVHGGPDGTTFEYDQPSTLFGQFPHPEIARVAQSLDEKMAELMAAVTSL